MPGASEKLAFVVYGVYKCRRMILQAGRCISGTWFAAWCYRKFLNSTINFSNQQYSEPDRQASALQFLFKSK